MSIDYLFQDRVIRIAIDYPDIRVDKPNIYLLKSQDGYSMIDCGGYSVESDFEVLCNRLNNIGIDLSEITEVFLTHTHKDHSLLAGRIQSVSGATVYMGSGDYHRLSGDIDSYRNFFSRVKDYLLSWGFRQDMVDRFFRSFNRQYYDAGLSMSNVRLVDRDMFHRSFDILSTPGHTSGSICMFHRESGLLFTGDTLIKKIVSVPIIEYSDNCKTSMITEHTKTLSKLRNVKYAAILPGHGDVISEEKEVIDTIFTYIERRAKRVESLLKEGADTVYDLAISLYGRDALYDVVNKEAPTVYVSDLMMPLEYLYQRDRISVEDGKIKLLS